jgi:hypothetical protein
MRHTPGRLVVTATNHALTGALIGLTVHNPWLALPAALLSHLVCDIIPHFGVDASDAWVKTARFTRYLLLDFAGCVVLVMILAMLRPEYWLLASICAFVATSPDLLWIRKFVLLRKGKQFERNLLEAFLGNIQWFQRPIGALVEAVWFVGAVVLLWQFF